MRSESRGSYLVINPKTGNKSLGKNLCSVAFGMAVLATAPVFADSPLGDTIEQVDVTGQSIDNTIGTGDAAQLLQEQGVDFSSAGGISSLPIIRGLNDERVKLVVDGAESTSACANHMNPALSYIDASRVSSVEVMAGLTPVSMGGDSIAGTIIIESEPTRYADSSESLLKSGSVGYFHSSNGNNNGVAATAVVANQNLSLTYSGSWDKADSYEDGDGSKVLDTLYKTQSHSLTLGWQGQDQELTAKLTHQEVPYQGFPNQYMDMVDNTSNGLNLRYLRDFAWGELTVLANGQDVDHEMGFFTDEKSGTMPMITEGLDLGYKVALAIPFSDTATLRTGHEFHHFELDDYWPAVVGSAMMGPMDYVNLNDASRDRYALFTEMERSHGAKWQTLVGLRYEHVVMNTGDVQAYNDTAMSMGDMSMGDSVMTMSADGVAAAEFNARSHERKDDNFDLTLLAKYQFSERANIEMGVARKTRSPSLYERYSWGRSSMAMAMIGWFGDGNGYVGNISLEPEVATTAALTFSWSGDSNELSIAPYFTYVDDYIDAQQVGTFNPRSSVISRPQLQFTNLDAELYGVEVNARHRLFGSADSDLSLRSEIAYTHGERSADGSDLYNIMPLNASLSLVHRYKQWSNTLQVQWVDDNDAVDALRLENTTDQYSLINFNTQLEWQQITLKAGVSNLLDEQYEEPLGGVYLSGWIASDRTEQFTALPGAGRSFDVGMRYNF